MNIEKFWLRFVPRLKGVVIGIMSVAVVIGIVSVAAFFSSTPDYRKPFVFEQGLKRLEIEVNRSCYYYVGILFRSRAEDRDGHEAIRKFFLTPTGGINMDIKMPALVDIFLLDEHGRHFLSIADFGGALSGWAYGPNPLKLFAGNFSLKPGKYTAMINIRDIDGDFSGFESEFFISGDPKFTCGDEGWFGVFGVLGLLWDSNWL